MVKSGDTLKKGINMAKKKRGRRPGLFRAIVIKCPKCGKEKSLEVPAKVIRSTKSVMAMGIPPKLVCKHYFQAFF